MKYIDWIRQQPCCVCMDDTGTDPHHLKGFKLGKNMKCDLLVIPLCREHHDAFHADPETWEDTYGTQERFLAWTLIRSEYEGWHLVEKT
jgi:hypothetical protein